MIGAVRVATALGEYPFAFRRLERRDGGVAVVGIVAGLEASVLVDCDDLRTVARTLAVPLAGALLFAAWRWRRTRSAST